MNFMREKITTSFFVSPLFISKKMVNHIEEYQNILSFFKDYLHNKGGGGDTFVTGGNFGYYK